MPDDRKSARRRYHGTALRLVGMAGLVGLFVRGADWEPVGVAVREAGWGAYLAVFAGFGVGQYFNGLAWRALLVPAGIRVGLLSMYLHDLGSMFWSNLLPGYVAGDVVKGARLAGGWERGETVAVALVAHRVLGAILACLAAAASVAFTGFEQQLQRGLLGTFCAMVAAGGAVLVALRLGPGGLRRFLPALARRLPGGAFPPVAALVRCGLAAGGAHLVFAVSYAVAIRSVAGLTFAESLCVYVAAAIAQALPVTVGGIGVRELTIAGLVTPLAGPEAGTAAALLVTAAQFSLIGVGGAAEAGRVIVGRRAA